MEKRSIFDLALRRDCWSLDEVTSAQSSLPRSCTHSMVRWNIGSKSKQIWLLAKSLFCDFLRIWSTLKMLRNLPINLISKIITQQFLRIYIIQNNPKYSKYFLHLFLKLPENSHTAHMVLHKPMLWVICWHQLIHANWSRISVVP